VGQRTSAPLHNPTGTYLTPYSQVNQGLTGTYRDILNTYWQHQVAKLETDEHDYKIHQLPLARIKKVMKADPEVKMISAEAPILFAKGCDIFITELTMRAWIHAEENKRRTLQRSDIASALMKSDMFDFLIDIVPREEAASHKRSAGQSASAAAQAQAQASAAAQVPPGQPHQQTGMHPPPPQMPPDYGMAPQMPHPGEEYQQPGVQNVYGAPPGMQPQGAPYGHHAPGGQMFGGDVYGYGMGQQQVTSPLPLAFLYIASTPPFSQNPAFRS